MIMPPQIRLYLELGAVAVLAIAFGLYTMHERSVGATQVHTADAKALNAARRQADAETQLNNERAAQADAGADRAQKAVDDYRAAHPAEPFRLCHPNDSVVGVREGGAAAGRQPGAGAGSAAVPTVPRGGESQGPDIAPELDALVSAAQRLDILYTDDQGRRGSR